MRKLIFLLALVVGFSAHAQTDDDNDSGAKPVATTSQATWLFSWTNDPRAAKDPAAHASRIFQSAQGCEAKIATATDPNADIPTCQGNGLAAGPGLYMTDNPFTSHDYGSTLVFSRSKSGDANIMDVSQSMRPADVIDPQLVAKKGVEAIVYPFRASETGGTAIVVRDGALLDTSPEALVMAAPKEFNVHAAYACSDTTDFRDILRQWGDQIDFLALVFDTFRDPTAKQFRNGNALNQPAWLAALSANIAAVPSDQVESRTAAVSAASSEIKQSLTAEACAEHDHVSPRACLVYELYVSLVGDMGTDNYPTGAWSFASLKKALLALKIISPAEASANRSLPALQMFLAKRFQSAPAQAQRAREAFHCAEVARQFFTTTALSTCVPK